MFSIKGQIANYKIRDDYANLFLRKKEFVGIKNFLWEVVVLFKYLKDTQIIFY